MSQDEKRLAFRALDVALTVLITIVLGLTSWNLNQTVQQGREIAGMQGNRFTSEDGLEVWREIATIQKEIAKLPTETPPQWFIDEVRGIKEAVGRIEDRLTTLERRSSP